MFLNKNLRTMIGMSLPLISLYGTVCSSCPFYALYIQLEYAETV